MTDIVPVPAPADISIYPALGSSNFNAEAYDFGTKMRPAAVRISEIAEGVHTNATAANERAMAASASAAAAVDAKDAVWAATNFKGLWSDLSGLLNMPATVKHMGRFWLLTRDVPIVQFEEPGVSDAWTADTSSVVIQEATAPLTMEAGVRYIVTAYGVTLTIPYSVLVGDSFSAMDASNFGFSVVWNGKTVKGQEPASPMEVPKLRGFSVTYSGSTFA